MDGIYQEVILRQRRDEGGLDSLEEVEALCSPPAREEPCH